MVVFGSLLTLLVCGTVFALGSGPGRAAALLVVAGLAGSLLLQVALGFRRQLPVLLADVALTAGFIALAYRHRRVWLAIVSFVLIALLIVHAWLAEAPRPPQTFAGAVNGLNLLALVVVAGGAVADARARSRRKPGAGSPQGATPRPLDAERHVP